MFTGIVEELGAVRSFDGDRLRITCTTVAADAGIGDSIAVNGICLTVVDLGDGGLAFDVSPETRRRTSVRDLVAGDVVNLERPLAFGARLGGHLVQGHVDGVAAVRSVTPAGDGAEIAFTLDPRLRRFLVDKGSVTLDGVSLTVASLLDDGFTVAFVPHTLRATTFGDARPGTVVNVEIDVIAKYVASSLPAGRGADAGVEPAGRGTTEPDSVAIPPSSAIRRPEVEGTR
jgi:riboflavin synthase